MTASLPGDRAGRRTSENVIGEFGRFVTCVAPEPMLLRSSVYRLNPVVVGVVRPVLKLIVPPATKASVRLETQGSISLIGSGSTWVTPVPSGPMLKILKTLPAWVVLSVALLRLLSIQIEWPSGAQKPCAFSDVAGAIEKLWVGSALVSRITCRITP